MKKEKQAYFRKYGKQGPWYWAPLRGLYNLTWRRFVDPLYRQQMASQLMGFVENCESLLDVGCADGCLGAALKKAHPSLSVMGVDVHSFPACRIPSQVFDGKHLPFEDGSFDVVLATDVLHHLDDIPGMLKEMARVSKKYLIIKDHYIHGIMSKALLGTIDFWGNQCFGTDCPFNYPTREQWCHYFSELGLVIEKEEFLQLGKGSDLHPILKLKVSRPVQSVGVKSFEPKSYMEEKELVLTGGKS